MKRGRKIMRFGFTMVELMAVLVILGLLAAFVARNFMGTTENARVIEAPSDVDNYAQGGYLRTKDLPKDGWGNDFIYVRMMDGDLPYEILSYGADGEEGGEGYNTDLSSADAF